MVTSVKLTKRTVDAIQADGRDFYVWDSELKGFGVRVRKTGGRTYIVQYKAGVGRDAPTRRYPIAPVGKVTPDQAREQAKLLLARVVGGEDPAKDKSEARAALRFDEMVDGYLDHVKALKKPKTHDLYSYLLNTYALPTLGKRAAASVSASDIAPLHQKLRDKKTAANRLLAVIGSMYSWAVSTKQLQRVESPVEGIERFRESARERYLSSEELQRLGDAIREAETVGIPWEPDPKKKTKHAPKAANRLLKIDPAVAAALRLYILTGARRGEILGLTWDMVDLERGLLFLPDSKTGQKSIVLNAPARTILASLPRVDRYVIPGQPKLMPNGIYESRPRADLKRPWSLVRKRAGLHADDENPLSQIRVRLHDLRHTHASFGVGASVGLPIVGKLLGHKQARTTERYAHLEDDPVRKASEMIGTRLSYAMGDPRQETGNVIPLKQDKQ